MEIHTLDAISSVDGRYRGYIDELADYFSEDALILNRLKVEVEYIISLSEHPKIGPRKFSDYEKRILKSLYKSESNHSFWVKHYEMDKHNIKEINNGKPTHHDVKAVEYYMKYSLRDSSLKDSLEWIHFGLTSEDVNNMAYGLMLSEGLEKVMIPNVENLNDKIESLAQKYKKIPMLARTHGQSASPTTLGKEFKVYSSRLERQIQQLEKYYVNVKLNGATGNYNAHKIAYPKVNWPAFSKKFINSFNKNRKIKLKPNLITTQIEPHDTYAELFDNLKRINVILTDFNQDIWRYISDDWITQKPVKGDVGSSTMPHKINPIDFENSEGNLGLANVLFEYFGRKLPISRLQRDLSDSTVERNFGLAFAHTLIGYKSIMKGLGKIDVNEEKVIFELENHPEVIAEAIQTVLRREGEEMPYEKLKELTRGKQITMENILMFIDDLDVSNKLKKELKGIKPTNYTGIAEKLV